MILDHLNNAYLYFGMHPLFKKAFAYLASNDFSKIENGTYELEGKDLLAIVNSYDTEAPDKRVWEGHRKYIDIQLVAAGIENMGYAPLQEAKVLEAYVDEHDFTKFDALGAEVTVPANYFTIFYPTDVHKPNLISGKTCWVKKVVMKVKLPEPLIQLTFASNNAHKLEEIRRKLAGTPVGVLGLQESGVNQELPEHGDTLEANAFQKANTVYSKFGLNCFADDTGLEVEALDGEPGVYSARYAGENASYADNVSKLLAALKGKTNRKARFRTVISLVLDATEYRFEGVINGRISENPHGTQGFGYDPVFVPDGYDQTFAEMDPDLKNKISHRGLAVEKLVRFLKEDVLN
jgi:XTP/dITP diphosphohydrolase